MGIRSPCDLRWADSSFLSVGSYNRLCISRLV